MTIVAEKYIPSIEFPTLPSALPSRRTIESWKQNEVHYDPAMWGLQYAVVRYLEGVTDDALKARYAEIVRNMRCYCVPTRDAIPIVSYDSSWYWHRKEYQTRLEFAYRKLPPPTPPNASDLFGFDSRIKRLTAPTGADILFRYGKKQHLLELLTNGRLRFAPAGSYDGIENNGARKDEELRKRYFKPGKHVKITTIDGRPIPVLGDVAYTVSSTPYHMACFSRDWDGQMFDDFEADACAVVLNPGEFFRRVERSGRAVFPGQYFHYNPVSYFDPYDVGRNEYLDSGMSKDFRFAYQNEFRVLWDQMDASEVVGYRFVEIGDTRDLVRLVDRTGSRLV